MTNPEHHFDCTHSSADVSIDCSIHRPRHVKSISLIINLASIDGEAAPSARLGLVSERESQGQQTATANTGITSALAETRQPVREEQLVPGNGGHFTAISSDVSSTSHITHNTPASDSAPFALTVTTGSD
ncbi:hypothetical protein DXG01_010729 [Tephrocybe rancida]|nr:hypothetical protein DXG01_010729 [Tephrocybe rancida]